MKEDQDTVETMRLALPPEPQEYQGVRNEDLETNLVALHEREGRAAGLREKYRAALAWDDKERDHIRADHRSRTHAMLSGD